MKGALAVSIYAAAIARDLGLLGGRKVYVAGSVMKQNPAEKENKTLERFFDLLDVMDMEW